jgi:squalene synthase HpnC
MPESAQSAQSDQAAQIAKLEHYENFPVGSVLLPRAMRAPVGVIYNFARSADDIADEGEAAPAERHAGLAAYQRGLDAIAAGRPAPAELPLFTALAEVVRAYRLDLQNFYDLLSAFDQDIDTYRYADQAALDDYCRRSANPVGRLMLALFGADTADNVACSDAICTALQLINFWQDVTIDWRKGRVYIPQAEMVRHAVRDADIDAQCCDSRWRALMQAQVQSTRALMLAGAPLARRMPGRFGLELCLVVQGGLRILEKIEQADYDVFRHRPKLGKADWALLMLRAGAMRWGPAAR